RIQKKPRATHASMVCRKDPRLHPAHGTRRPPSPWVSRLWPACCCSGVLRRPTRSLEVDDAVVVRLAIAVVSGLGVLQHCLAETVLVHHDYVVRLLELVDQASFGSDDFAARLFGCFLHHVSED